MRLEALAATLPGAAVHGDGGVAVTGLSCDSRLIQPGWLFVAVRGHSDDGLRYVGDAVRRGAVAVVADRPVTAGVPVVQVADARRALSRYAAFLYNHPSRAMRVIGVTGTNGKTTTTYLIKSIMAAAGRRSEVIGTLGATDGETVRKLTVTTPESCDIQRLLSALRDRGVTDVTMEVSSHALVLSRVADVEFEAAVFTNLSRDHLDYHRDLGEYRTAKESLFRIVKPRSGRVAVVNADDESGKFMAAAARVPVITYGLSGDADVNGIITGMTPRSLTLDVNAGGHRFEVETQLTGRFNASNCLAAVAVSLGLGIDVDDIVAGIRALPGVLGRFERVRVEGGERLPTVIVDYAHTPDSLDNVLRTARECTRGRLIAVFGCGGDRDRTKRPVMARIGVELADLVYLTSDNPRTEDPEQIIREMEAGAGPTANYRVVPNRARAITEAILAAAPDDLVVIAGKGHEDYQIIGRQRNPFDDRKVAADALMQRTAREER